MYREFKHKVFEVSSPRLQEFFETEKGKEDLRGLYYYYETSFPWTYIENKINKLEQDLVSLKS